ncbi:hypothetical protein O181_109289 [Austropuccinia psidii MF-1]|uniref:Reverse transcriptase Ty1/copia-type domain-containing protein n=1 Tax=Austropuccinia psidii MF-1 TaxID=1389203 RepID=A0A9Q3JXU0_9BASI|nr:hypothetical protein [Austropuccinia psidii MF-1]
MERLLNIQPNPDPLFPFVVRAIVHVPQEKSTKLDARVTECILLTYPKSGKVWTFLNVPSRRIFTSTSAVFADYQHLTVATNTKKGNVAFILNHLRLGEPEFTLTSPGIESEIQPSHARFDVNAAYLDSPIGEDVFVQAPVELRPELAGKVMKLKKTLYGTKQAAWCWWQYSRSVMESLGFCGDEIKPSIYLFKRHGAFVIVWAHVDNGIVLSNSANALTSLKTKLKMKLKLNWSNHVDKIVGLNIGMGTGKLEISQPLLTKQLLDNYHRPIRDQFMNLPDRQIVTNEGQLIDQTRYQSVLSSLMYLSLGSRPDITYAVNLLARFSSNPGQKHWEGLDHLIGYLCRHQHQPLIYNKKDQGLLLWTDANWGGEHERSTSGFMVKAFGNLIARGSKQQHVVAMSTCASEYVAQVSGMQLMAYIRLVAEPILSQIPLTIHCDNKAAIMIAEDNLSKKRTKYLDREVYFVNNFVQQFNVKLQWMPTAIQHADVLTKSVGQVKMGKEREQLV